jgi:hypothetical protein
MRQSARGVRVAADPQSELGEARTPSPFTETAASTLGLTPRRMARPRGGRIRPVAVLKIAKFWPPAKRSGVIAGAGVDEVIGLEAFGSETVPAPVDAVAPFGTATAAKAAQGGGAARLHLRRRWLAALLLVVLPAFGVGAYELRRHPIAWRPATGTIRVETVPQGIEVFVAGKSVGRSPIAFALQPGSYEVRLGAGEQSRTFSVDVLAGASVLQHYEMANAIAPSPATGALEILTDPARLPILLDGVDKGLSPATIANLTPGEHEVTVRSAQNVIKRTVHVPAGKTTSVIVTSVPSRPEPGTVTAGWLRIASKVPLQIREGASLLGTSDVEKLMIPAGMHTIELVNETLDFRVQRQVKVVPGSTTVTRVDLPNGSLSLNALPWADVFVDGESVGQTPVGNLALPIGRHEILFRHPDLGDRKEFVNVTTHGTARLGVDLRRK